MTKLILLVVTLFSVFSTAYADSYGNTNNWNVKATCEDVHRFAAQSRARGTNIVVNCIPKSAFTQQRTLKKSYAPTKGENEALNEIDKLLRRYDPSYKLR